MASWGVIAILEFDTAAGRAVVSTLINSDLAGEAIHRHGSHDYAGRPARPGVIGHKRAAWFTSAARARLFYDRVVARLNSSSIRGKVSLHFCPEQDQPAWNCRTGAQAQYQETVL